MPTIRYLSLAAGEVSDRLAARTDQIKYQIGARVMRNFVPTLEGAAQNRSGSGYVRPCHDFTADHPPRMLPFIYSDDESYVIVLQDGRLSVIADASPQFDAAKFISTASQTDPCVVSVIGHGLDTGDLVWISGVKGMTQLNNRFFRVVVITLHNLELQEESGVTVDSTGYSAHTSGGTIQRVHTIDAPWAGEHLTAIRYAQSGDKMLFAHPLYPVYQLELTAGPTWTLSQVAFGPEISGITGGAGSGNTAGSEDIRYQITAVSEDTLEESFPRVATPVAIASAAETALGAAKTITGITAANPPVVTSAAHGFTNGQFVYIDGVTGMTEVNGAYYQVAAAAPNTFALQQNGVNVNGSGWTAYAAGGEAKLATRLLVTTSSNHALTDNDEISFDGMEAPFTALNSGYYVVDVLTATTFAIKDKYGATTQSDNPAAATMVRTAIYLPSITFPSDSARVTLTWNAVIGALEYNVYRSINGIYSFVGVSATESFIDKGYGEDPYDTPPIDRDVFAEPGDYPAVVGLFQQRTLFGGSINEPERCDAGQTGRLYNFTKSNPIKSDDSFSWYMRSNQKQGIRHIVEMSRCLVFTQAAVFTLEGDESGALLPTAVNPRKRAEHGVGDVAPIPIGNAVLYLQSPGKIVREILPGSGDDFNSKDLTVYSRHLFDRNTIISMSFAEEPHSIVWCARDDGQLLALTYQREHQVEGWSRHDTGDGDEVVDVCCVPEGNETATYLVVRRYDIGPGPRYYIERMASRQVAHAADGKFLDSYRFYETENAVGTSRLILDYGTSHTTEALWTLTVDGTMSAWVAGDVGKVFLIYGDNDERVWCTVTEIIDADHAVVEVRTDVLRSIDENGAPNGEDVEEEVGVPFPLAMPFTTAGFSSSISAVTDAWHAEGREVYAVVDGYPQGPFTVTNGSFTLESPGVLVVWGLQIIADVEPLEPENPDGGETWADRSKTVGKVTVRVQETDGLQVGLSVDGLQEFTADWKEPDTHHEGHLYTGRLTVENRAVQTPQSRVLLRQSSGLPTTILGVYAQVEIGDR